MSLLTEVISPLSPKLWQRYARGLQTGPGWFPSMMLWAATGVVLAFNFGLARDWGLPWLEAFNILGWAAWGIIALLAMSLTVRASVVHLLRLGILGITRPRWWFEIGLIFWNVFSVLAAGVLLFVQGSRGRPPQGWWSLMGALLNSAALAAGVFFAATTIGYTLSVFRRLPRRGRAYDGVIYFYSLLSPLALGTYAIASLPPQPDVADWTWSIGLGTISLIWFVAAFITSIIRWEAWERSRTGREMRG